MDLSQAYRFTGDAKYANQFHFNGGVTFRF